MTPAGTGGVGAALLDVLVATQARVLERRALPEVLGGLATGIARATGAVSVLVAAGGREARVTRDVDGAGEDLLGAAAGGADDMTLAGLALPVSGRVAWVRAPAEVASDAVVLTVHDDGADGPGHDGWQQLLEALAGLAALAAARSRPAAVPAPAPDPAPAPALPADRTTTLAPVRVDASASDRNTTPDAPRRRRHLVGLDPAAPRDASPPAGAASIGGTGADAGVARALWQAVDAGEFVVHYQPLVDLRTRRVIGAEALVRWDAPGRGVLAPAAFIQDAERTGAIVDIGRHVLRRACHDLAALGRDRPELELRASVNLSARQLASPRLLDDVAEALASSGIVPEQVVLEVTETMAVDAASIEVLHALKALGPRLAIDDFGTGFSCLSSLKDLPFDLLKIDRSFVSGLGSATNTGGVVRAVLALAREMDLQVVAEGIETAVELAQLRALRCGHGQGYLFSRPVPIEAFDRLVQVSGVAA